MLRRGCCGTAPGSRPIKGKERVEVKQERDSTPQLLPFEKCMVARDLNAR